jgi:uncharacterized protein involved in exopolysaccharide biosynthesis
LQHELLTQLGETLGQAKNRRLELETRIAVVDGLRRENLVSAGRPRLVSLKEPSTLAAEAPPAEDAPAAPPQSVDNGSDQALWQLAQETVDGLDHLQEQLFAAQAREKELSEKFGHKHPEVRAVREQIANWQALLRQRLDAVPAVLEQQLDAANRQEQQLTALYQAEFGKAREVDHYVLKEQQALSHIERTQEIHDSVLAQLRQWQLADQALAQGRTGISVSVLEGPALAEQQVWPPQLLLLGACSLVGLIGGVGTATLLGRNGEGAGAAPLATRAPRVQPRGAM